MQKFRIAFAFLVAVLLALSVVAYAAVAPPYSVVENGNTYLRTFVLSGIPESDRAYFVDCMSNSRNGIVFGKGVYHFFSVPNNVELVIKQNSINPDLLNIETSDRSTSLHVLSFTRDGENFVLSDSRVTYQLASLSLIVGGRYWRGVTIPSFATDHVAVHTGDLYIVTDDGTSGGGGDDGGGILDWLLNFWKKFVDTIKGLFIPSADYFKNFFDEIKSAFDKKLGGLSDLLGSLGSSFESLKNSTAKTTLTIKMPDNQLFAGYKGITVDVLKYVGPVLSFIRGLFNAILVVSTIIICYRKLIAVVKT